MVRKKTPKLPELGAFVKNQLKSKNTMVGEKSTKNYMGMGVISMKIKTRYTGLHNPTGRKIIK